MLRMNHGSLALAFLLFAAGCMAPNSGSSGTVDGDYDWREDGVGAAQSRYFHLGRIHVQLEASECDVPDGYERYSHEYGLAERARWNSSERVLYLPRTHGVGEIDPGDSLLVLDYDWTACYATIQDHELVKRDRGVLTQVKDLGLRTIIWAPPIQLPEGDVVPPHLELYNSIDELGFDVYPGKTRSFGMARDYEFPAYYRERGYEWNGLRYEGTVAVQYLDFVPVANIVIE